MSTAKNIAAARAKLALLESVAPENLQEQAGPLPTWLGAVLARAWFTHSLSLETP